MDIAIIAATELEMAPLRKMVLPYSKGKIDLSITGVGPIPTAFSVSRLITNKRPTAIIQMGIAGCFDQQIKIGTAVAVQSEIMADMGVYEDGMYKDIFQMGLTPYDAFPYENGCLNNTHEDLLNKAGIQQVKAVSVSEITTLQTKIDLFHHHYGAEIESMEGAAFHYTCLAENIPFIQLRGISNIVGIRDKKQWNIPEALSAVRTACLNLLESL
jgi:futalosine hydrolase